VLTREQAEAIGARAGTADRFLLPYGEQAEKFAADESPPSFAMLPGETIWQYGEPLYVDMAEVLRTVADGAESPDPNAVLLPVSEVVAAAKQRFGDGEDHTIETIFDAFVMELGGVVERDPPAYRVNFTRLLGM
jgi:hypothetical protein